MNIITLYVRGSMLLILVSRSYSIGHVGGISTIKKYTMKINYVHATLVCEYCIQKRNYRLRKVNVWVHRRMKYTYLHDAGIPRPVRVLRALLPTTNP